MGFSTQAIHSAYPTKELFGALRYPIYQNAAFEYGSAQELEDVFCGRSAGHTYSRATNPTIDELEKKVTTLAGALGVVATASGMAAISNTFFALLKSGDNIVTTNRLFGHTLSLFQNTFEDFGVEIRFVDILDEKDVVANIDSQTKAIFFETISNPELVVADIALLSKIAKQHRLVLVADTTMTPLYLFDSKSFGVDIEIISATKYLSGGGTNIGGLIIDNGSFDWGIFSNLEKFYAKFNQNAFIAKLKKQSFRNIGSALAPQSAYMLSLGLETLALRADKSGANTKQLAEFLQNALGVLAVNYPDLPTSPYYEVSKKQFLFGGSILTFDLASKHQAYSFMNKLNIIRRATNIQDNKSLIIAPYHTIYSEYSDEQKRSFGLREGTLRLSVGIEDLEDLIEDISQALE